MAIKIKLLLIVVFVITIFIYTPALNSPFIFDDFYNLSGLSDLVNRGWLNFILGNFSGPTGRPLSMLSFAVQHNSWPDNPQLFKAINLLIHCLNGLLLFFISKIIINRSDFNLAEKNVFILTVVSYWMLHPIHLTTVLYAVQRMTQLATLFTLAGLLVWFRLREDLLVKSNICNPIIAAAIIWSCCLMAILSKENGILLLLLIIVIEVTLFSKNNVLNQNRKWAAIVLAMPLALLAIYLLSNLSGIAVSYQFRDFNLWQRLLTQPVVIIDYLKLLILPTYGSFSLFHDDYVVSTSFFSPPKTILCWFILIGLLVFAIKKRKKLPIVSLGILWFFFMHSLEASFVNLELYFEHRNYLPSIGIALLAGVITVNYYNYFTEKRIPLFLISMYLLWITTVLFLESGNWARPLIQAIEWVRFQPQSERSLNYLATQYIRNGDTDNAIKTYHQIDKQEENSVFARLNILKLQECFIKQLEDSEAWSAIVSEAAYSKAKGQRIIALLDNYLLLALQGKCDDNTIRNLELLLKRLLENKNYNHIKSYLLEFLAIIEYVYMDYKNSLQHIKSSILISHSAEKYGLQLNIINKTQSRDELEKMRNDIKDIIRHNPKYYFTYQKLLKEIESTEL